MKKVVRPLALLIAILLFFSFIGMPGLSLGSLLDEQESMGKENSRFPVNHFPGWVEQTDVGVNTKLIAGNDILPAGAKETVIDILPLSSYGTISGRVTDADTGKGIADVWVSVSTPYFFVDTYTDANGDYSLQVAVGTHSIYVHGDDVGYVFASRGDIEVSENDELEHNFSLIPAENFGTVRLVSISPSPGTTLIRGSSVDFEVTIDYELYNIPEAIIGPVIGHQGAGLFIGNQKVTRSAGTVVLGRSLDVDDFDWLQVDKVHLYILLCYEPEPCTRFILRIDIPECCYYIEGPAGPTVNSISPVPVPGSNQRQWLTLTGSGFVPQSRVTLRTGGSTYPIPPDRTEYRSSSEIRVFVNVTAAPATWTAQVINPGPVASPEKEFTVAWAGEQPGDFAEVNRLLETAARKYNLPPVLLKAIAFAESDWQHRENGAVKIRYEDDGRHGLGLMQVTVYPGDSRYQRLCSDLSYNVDEGARILKEKYLESQRTNPAGSLADDPNLIENWWYAALMYNGWGQEAVEYVTKVRNYVISPPAPVADYMDALGWTSPFSVIPGFKLGDYISARPNNSFVYKKKGGTTFSTHPGTVHRWSPGKEGAMMLTVEGLPQGVDADVRVTGPGVDQSVSGSATLQRIVPGDYTVKANDVTFGGRLYVPVVSRIMPTGDSRLLDVLVIEGASSLVRVTYKKTDIPSQVDDAIRWAQAQLGSGAYAYYCLLFAQHAYILGSDLGLKGIPWEYAKKAADKLKSMGNIDKPIPRGAFVFYDWIAEIGGETADWGHVGIALESGNLHEISMIHSYVTVRQDSADLAAVYPTQGFEYIGWAWPDANYPQGERILPYQVNMATSNSQFPAQAGEIDIPDAGLEGALREALDKPEGAITAEDMAALTGLAASQCDITDLIGLETAVNLTELFLRDNNLADLDPLAGLVSLQRLDLGNNRIDNIEPLGDLAGLRELYLNGNGISDIDTLLHLTSLEWLDLRSNRLEDLTALAALSDLRWLCLGDNLLTGIEPLAGLNSLQWLELRYNYLDLAEGSPAGQVLETLTSGGTDTGYLPQKDEGPIDDFAVTCIDDGRVEFSFSAPAGAATVKIQQKVADGEFCDAVHGTLGAESKTAAVTALANGSSYTFRLVVEGGFRAGYSNEVSSVPNAPVVVAIPDPGLEAAVREALDRPAGEITSHDLAGLISLDASWREIDDLSGIEYARNLQELNLWGNRLTAVDALANLEKLKVLNLRSNLLANSGPLGSLSDLSWLDLSDNLLNNIGSLTNLTGLVGLNLSGNSISDLTTLDEMSGLQLLYLDNNRITDAAPLSNLADLQVLSLNRNELSCISPLGGLANLLSLGVANNRLTSVDLTAGVDQLQDLDLSGNNIADIDALNHLPGLLEANLVFNYLDLTPGSEAIQIIETLQSEGITIDYKPQNILGDECTYGDLNADGDVNVADAILVLRSIVGLVSLEPYQALIADVNGDGNVNVGDAILILRYIVGLIQEFPV